MTLRYRTVSQLHAKIKFQDVRSSHGLMEMALECVRL